METKTLLLGISRPDWYYVGSGFKLSIKETEWRDPNMEVPPEKDLRIRNK
jgi:hypothetical protein